MEIRCKRMESRKLLEVFAHSYLEILQVTPCSVQAKRCVLSHLASKRWISNEVNFRDSHLISPWDAKINFRDTPVIFITGPVAIYLLLPPPAAASPLSARLTTS
jgi:hypothetical protein